MANNQFKLVPVDYSKPYNQQPDCKRHVIGAYANLARHNMTVTINVIMQAIGMDIINENDIDNAFNKNHRKKIANLDNIQKVNLQKRLYRHFPFFKRMKLEDETKKSVQLNTLLEVMADFTSCMAILRNFYTHYLPYNTSTEWNNQLDLKKKMGKRLQYLYENTSQMFKSNESLDHESNEVFAALRMPVDSIEEITPHDKDYDKLLNLINDPQTPHFKKRGLKLNRETNVITRQSIKFVRNPEYQAYMMDDENGMSDTAIIYFLCLFLEKKVSFELMNDVGFTEQIQFKGEHADKQMLYLKEIMCMNRIRMTKTKLDSEMNDTALALDMINELRKCPKPLYDVLDTNARKEFKDDATVIWENEHGSEAVTTEETQDNDNGEVTESTTDKDTPRSTFVRWEDRFPQMALKYIDMTGMFNDIRFQLNLGKYRYAFYQHDASYSIDREERLRILQKEMHGFGRPIEVDEKKDTKWGGIYERKTIEDGLTYKEADKVGQVPYVTNQRAQYAIDEKSHSIGIRWEGWDNNQSRPHYGDLDNKKMFIPYLPENPTQPQTGEIPRNQGETLLPPQMMLSLYEIPDLLFYHYLLKKTNKECIQVEETIKRYWQNLKNFFTDISKGDLVPIDNGGTKELEGILNSRYGLRLKDIPEKFEKYLLSIPTDYDEKIKTSAFTRLESLKQKVKRSLVSYQNTKQKIGTKENKFDKMRATIKTGALAQWLIRDIMDWLPNDSTARKKLTGQNYTALQSDMALLGQTFETNNGVYKMTLQKLEDAMSKSEIIADSLDNHSAKCYHPFLHLVFRDYEGDSIEDFYELYLQKELKYIDNAIAFLNNANDNNIAIRYRYVPFLHSSRSRWQNKDADAMKKLAASYLERPLQLPKGVFTGLIYNLLLEIAKTNDNQKESQYKADLYKALEEARNGKEDLSNNVAYLMKLYFKYIEHDHPQHFYSTATIVGQPSPYRHVYNIFKKLYGKPIPRSNKTTSPAYTIEEIRDLKKKALKDIELYVTKEIETNWPRFKFERDIKKKLQKENDRRYKNHEKQLNINEEVQKAVKKEIANIRQELTDKLKKQLKKVYDNERTIRRYKAQDMLLLVMAREILKAKSQNQDFTKDFCLKYVMTDSLLDKRIDFSWDVLIRDKEKGSVRKSIEQKEMKMKNYGQFYKFASDHQRLESLLSRLPQSVFLRSEIENEFSYYDTNRSEVFRQVYIIESEAYKLKPELTDDSNAGNSWFYYIDKKTGKPRPIRNSFIQLLEVLAAGKDGILDEEEKDVLRNTRNAFGHNTYDVDFDTVFKGKEAKKKIPEVANGIKDKIEEQSEILKKNLKK